MILVLLFAVAAAAGHGTDPSQQRVLLPSLLICTPTPQALFPGEWVSMHFMRSLQDAGVQVDYTTSLADLNRTRIWNYTALLLFESPLASLMREAPQNPVIDPKAAAEFPSVVHEYVDAGGGVLLMPSERLRRPDTSGAFPPAVFCFWGKKNGGGVEPTRPHPGPKGEEAYGFPD